MYPEASQNGPATTSAGNRERPVRHPRIWPRFIQKTGPHCGTNPWNSAGSPSRSCRGNSRSSKRRRLQSKPSARAGTTWWRKAHRLAGLHKAWRKMRSGRSRGDPLAGPMGHNLQARFFVLFKPHRTRRWFAPARADWRRSGRGTAGCPGRRRSPRRVAIEPPHRTSFPPRPQWPRSLRPGRGH